MANPEVPDRITLKGRTLCRAESYITIVMMLSFNRSSTMRRRGNHHQDVVVRNQESFDGCLPFLNRLSGVAMYKDFGHTRRAKWSQIHADITHLSTKIFESFDGPCIMH